MTNDDFVPNSMNEKEFKEKVLKHLDYFIEHTHGKLTFQDWLDEFGDWMAMGAQDLE